MKFKLIYPRWNKLQQQTEFNLPPHGPVVMAAEIPDWVEVQFVDENLQELDLHDSPDLVGISMMLTTQVKRGLAIADAYRARSVPVIFGGIATMLHGMEVMGHADSVFLGEVEGRLAGVFDDFRKGELKKLYNFINDRPAIELVGPARRDILDRDLYYHKGVRMVDLFHASRGCRFKCYPCAVSFLGGRKFRPRPFDRVLEELETIDNPRLFLVDNSLAQDTEWEKQLFREMISMKKTWCSHTIEDDPQVLDLAAQAGAWYVYQAVFDTSDYIKERIKRYHDHGIGVEGTILLGLDHHTEDYIKKLVEFLLDIDLDLAEFTILTPFPHTKAHDDMLKQGRILSEDWDRYDACQAIYQPKHMSPQRLEELYHWAWEEFYKDEPQNMKMFRLLKRAVERERSLGTYQGRRRDLIDRSFGKKVDTRLSKEVRPK